MERACAGLSLVWLLGACAASEGALFTAHPDAGGMTPQVDGAASEPDAGSEPDAASELDAASARDADSASDRSEPEASAPDAGTDAGPIQPGMRIQYQLSGTLDQSADADLFVIDLFETSRTQIQQLHAAGKTVVAFVSAGTVEPWRPDVGKLPEAAIGEPLAGYPQEAWLDVRDPNVRDMLVGRITQAADKGFDGVLLVSLDAYLANSGHDLTAADQLAYNVWLAQRAAEVGLTAGLSSDWMHASQLAPYYGFAIHLNCIADQRCSELAPYRARGRAVFDLETGTTDQASVCGAADQMDLPVTLKRSSFDAWSMPCR